jgi:hypothetical protein
MGDKSLNSSEAMQYPPSVLPDGQLAVSMPEQENILICAVAPEVTVVTRQVSVGSCSKDLSAGVPEHDLPPRDDVMYVI